ncbi:NACHT, LRR and PYD domains-containing protein 12-like [Gastrophryne carolinensis]
MEGDRVQGWEHPVDKNREKLIQSITMVLPVLDHLLQEGLVTQEQYDTVKNENTSQDKIRKLFQYSRGWSGSDKDTLYQAMKSANPGVTENLEGTSLSEKQKMEFYDRIQECKVKYMASIKQRYQLIKEHNSRPGESVDLEDRYAPLLMIRNYRSKNEKEHEMTSLGESHLQIMEERASEKHTATNIQALFDPNPRGITPVAVVLHGPAGIGKTMTSHKIMLDWASGNIYEKKFDFVFYLSCRELNNITGNISLARLLPRTCGLWFLEDMKSILSHSRKLLFIIDGFDELKWSFRNVEGDVQDIFQETSVEIILKCLFTKKALWEASLLITTRPLALQKLDDLLRDPHSCFVEILGFTGKDCEEYVHHFFENKDDADKVMRIITDNDILFTMCTIPIVCWIVCTVLKPQMKKDFYLIQCKTATSIYLLYLKGLMKYHGRNLPMHACLKKLCALANEGVFRQIILFEEEDLQRHGLTLSEVESVFLNENIFHVDIEIQTCYSFVHLSVQEFLSGLYYVIDDEDGVSDAGKDTFLPEICKGKSLEQLCRENSHLALAVRFLFGLLNEEEVMAFSKSTGCKISLRVKPALRDWIMGNSLSNYSADVICCLYETQNEDFVRSVMSRSPILKLSNKKLEESRRGNACLKQLSYCLKIGNRFETLGFKHFSMNLEDMEVLSPLLHTCQDLILKSCEFPERAFIDSENIADTEKSANLSWLANPESAVRQLTLQNCLVPPSCWDYLHTVFILNQSLATLDLSDNHLEAAGVMALCRGLKDCSCRLRELSLCMCGLTHLGCEDLRSVLVTNRSLKNLDLSSNHIRDSGVKVICEGLRDPRCILQELSLSTCRFSRLRALGCLLVNRGFKLL